MAKTAVAVPSTLKKYTTLSELEASEKGPVYVMNNLKGEFKGMIIVPVARRQGNGHDVVRIPPTFIPVDLTQQVGKTQLMESTEFRQTVGKNLIRLVTTEYAEKILAQEDAQVEAQTVLNNMSRARTMVESTLLNEGKKTGAAAMVNDIEDENPIDSAGKINKEKIPVSSRVKLAVEQMLKAELSQPEIIAKLKNMAPLRRVDIRHCLKYFKTFPRVNTYLEAELEKAKARAAKANA